MCGFPAWPEVDPKVAMDQIPPVSARRDRLTQLFDAVQRHPARIGLASNRLRHGRGWCCGDWGNGWRGTGDMSESGRVYAAGLRHSSGADAGAIPPNRSPRVPPGPSRWGGFLKDSAIGTAVVHTRRIADFPR